ncbi:MAG: Lrp/AsnC family transcriptional regulator [Blastocatellia bacterium]|nr:Lrp/AsnC family transcriptional regulator [Blastocatellia bacterium]
MNENASRPNTEELDDIDRKILLLLQKNGRMTNAALAEAVGLTPTPMLQRIKKLEQKGVIKGYTAIVDATALGRKVMAFVDVTLAKHDIAIHERFVEEVCKFEEVLECHHIAGEQDFLLKVVVRDIAEYESFLLKRITAIGGISRIKTTLVLSSPKMETVIGVDPERGEKR